MLQNGILRCLDISNSEHKILEQVDVGCPVTSVDWSPNYHTLALGSSKVLCNKYYNMLRTATKIM